MGGGALVLADNARPWPRNCPSPDSKTDAGGLPEHRFRLLVESVVDYAIFMLGPDGTVLSWNLGAERLKGYTAKEIIGQPFSVFYPPEAIAAGWPQHELDTATRTGRYEEEGCGSGRTAAPSGPASSITALRGTDGTLRASPRSRATSARSACATKRSGRARSSSG